MSFKILIGEREKDDDEEMLFPYCVKELILEEAPRFLGDSYSHYKNSRYPSNSDFHDFLKEVGLYDFFCLNFGDGCLIEESNGIRQIYKFHLNEIKLSRVNYQLLYPNAKPEVFSENDFTKDDCINYNLIRLMWFEWWFDWAIENCKRPSFYYGC